MKPPSAPSSARRAAAKIASRSAGTGYICASVSAAGMSGAAIRRVTSTRRNIFTRRSTRSWLRSSRAKTGRGVMQMNASFRSTITLNNLPRVVRINSQTNMESCEHLVEIRDVTPSANGCEDCLKIGATWVHLRLCEICGHVGCCDNSPNRHATKHARATSHPVIASAEPGERWLYCYPDEAFAEY